MAPDKETAYGFTREGKVFIKPYLEFPERQIGEVKTTPEEAITYFEKRFDHIKAKVDDLVQHIEAEPVNKGSFLMKLIHLRSQMGTYDGLGNFEALIKKLNGVEAGINEIVAVNRVKNLEIKNGLLVELNEAVTTISDFTEANNKVKDVRDRWLKTGSVDKEHDTLHVEENFERVLEDFYARRKVFFDERMKVMHERIEKYANLVDRARDLLHTPDAPAGPLIRKFKMLQEEWKAVGPIPRAHFEPLIVAFKQSHAQLARSFKRQRRDRVPTPEERAAFDNLKKKQGLIDKVNELNNLDLREAFNKAREYQNEWRAIGNVPENKKREINDKFATATDRIFELSYLMRTVYVRYRFFNTKSPEEQNAVRALVLQEIIKKDEEELEYLNRAYNSLDVNNRTDPNVKQAYNKVKTQERKLKVKNQLLDEFEGRALPPQPEPPRPIRMYNHEGNTYSSDSQPPGAYDREQHYRTDGTGTSSYQPREPRTDGGYNREPGNNDGGSYNRDYNREQRPFNREPRTDNSYSRDYNRQPGSDSSYGNRSSSNYNRDQDYKRDS